MSTAAFSFPFAHWTPSARSVTTSADATIAKFLHDRLLVGLSSGEICVFTLDRHDAPDSNNTPRLQARLQGHHSPVVSLEPLHTLSETPPATEQLLLSLSADGALSKWAVADWRCLQARASTTPDAATRPRGMLVVQDSGVGEGQGQGQRLTDSLVLVYACNTEIVVLNAESLETVFVWSGHVDWPIPLAIGHGASEAAGERGGGGGGGGGGGCALLTILPRGEVQSWMLTATRETKQKGKKKPVSVLTVRRNGEGGGGSGWSIECNPAWGRVRSWHRLPAGNSNNGYLVVQARGVSVHVAAAKPRGFIKTGEVSFLADGDGEIIGVEMATPPPTATTTAAAAAVTTTAAATAATAASRTVVIKTDKGGIKVATLGATNQLTFMASWSPPAQGSFLQQNVMNTAATAVFGDGNLAATTGKIAVVSRLKIQPGAVVGSRPGLDISIADIDIDIAIGQGTGSCTINAWDEKALTKSLGLDRDGDDRDEPCTCSEIFSNMLALARGMHIDLYSTSAFLLSFHEPTASIALDRSDKDATAICLLKRVRIGESGSGPDRPTASGGGGKEYLVVGTQSGNLSLIESPSYQCSRRLPLFSSSVHSAHVLPATLGRRLRSTLLVSSVDGTVSIVDTERATAMATFPNHDCSPLVAFATLPGQNMVALTHRDGVRQEWNMGEEDGGVLVNPPPSRGSSTSAHSQEDAATAADNANGVGGVGGGGGGGGVGWIAVRLDSGEEDKDDNGDGVLQPWDGFCRVGLPTAAVNVRAILASLDEAAKTAAQRTRPAERRVVANHPAVVSARCLLTALVPEGDLGAYLYGDEKRSGEEGDDDCKVEEWKAAVNQFLFRRRGTRPAALGQIGAGRRVSMLTPGEADEENKDENELSPTFTSIRFLAVLSLVSMLLQATGKAAMMDDGILDRMIHKNLGRCRRRCRTVALGVFAKFWSDARPVIRRVARACLDASMDALTESERRTLVDYWRCYLPVLVPPELSSAKEVVRSVIVLGKLITDYDHGYDGSLKKSVAQSAELLLHESDPVYQDTAMEMIGYSWTPFQNYFDAYAAIHSLVRISATTSPALPAARRELIHRSFLEIAAKNSPLLASSLANNISSGSSSRGATPTAAPQGLAEVSAEAMRIVIFIVRTQPTVFAADVLSVLVEAVLKILDPSSSFNSSNSGLRERVLPTVTELVEALVRSYSVLAFHRPSQRLALSAAPGIIGVYDLKTSQTSYVLDGHRRLASHLCFNVDGKCLAALDTAEKTLYVWRFGGGLLSYLGTEGDKPLQPRAKRVYDSDAVVVEVAWEAERKAVVRLEDGGEVEAVV